MRKELKSTFAPITGALLPIIGTGCQRETLEIYLFYLPKLLKKSIISLPAKSHIRPLIRKNIKPTKPTRFSHTLKFFFSLFGSGSIIAGCNTGAILHYTAQSFMGSIANWQSLAHTTAA